MTAPAYVLVYPLDSKGNREKEPFETETNSDTMTSASHEARKCVGVDYIGINIMKSGGMNGGKIGYSNNPEPIHIEISSSETSNYVKIMSKLAEKGASQVDLKAYLFRAGLETSELPAAEQPKNNVAKGAPHNWFTIEATKAQLIHHTYGPGGFQMYFEAESVRFIDHLSGGDQMYSYKDRDAAKKK